MGNPNTPHVHVYMEMCVGGLSAHTALATPAGVAAARPTHFFSHMHAAVACLPACLTSRLIDCAAQQSCVEAQHGGSSEKKGVEWMAGNINTNSCAPRDKTGKVSKGGMQTQKTEAAE